MIKIELANMMTLSNAKAKKKKGKKKGKKEKEEEKGSKITRLQID